MFGKTQYFENMTRQLELALEKYRKTKTDLEENTEIIKNWLKTQPHLPEIPDDVLIGNFLFMNKFSIENTKQRLDMYYTKQSLIPDFFQNIQPRHPNMRFFIDNVYLFPTPRSTDDGHRIIILKLVDTNPEHFHAAELFASFFNLLEMRLHEDYFTGDILVYDFLDVSLDHFVKITPMLIKKAVFVFEKVFNNSLHQMHLVNYPSFAVPLLKIAKKMMKPKLAERIHLHLKMETLTNFVSMKFLPKELGGEEMSLKELHDLWKLKVEDYNDRFDVLGKLTIDESKRPSPLINDNSLGYYGNFKKLCVD